jgi:hypothetical protein
MEFVEKKEMQNGEEIINYFINNKQVDKKTYDILSKDEFCKNAIPKRKKSKVNITKEKEDTLNYSSDNFKYAKTFLEELEGLNEEEKLNFIVSQINDLVVLSYYNGQIDLSKSLATGIKGLTKELEDLSENFSQEDL